MNDDDNTENHINPVSYVTIPRKDLKKFVRVHTNPWSPKKSGKEEKNKEGAYIPGEIKDVKVCSLWCQAEIISVSNDEILFKYQHIIPRLLTHLQYQHRKLQMNDFSYKESASTSGVICEDISCGLERWVLLYTVYFYIIRIVFYFIIYYFCIK